MSESPRWNFSERPGWATFLHDGYRDVLHLKTFIKMSKPRGRNDDLSYLSTQAVFEYLRLRFGKQVDGMVFPSVQTGEAGTNVVLFPEASVIAKQHYVPDVQVAFRNAEKLAFVDQSLSFLLGDVFQRSSLWHLRQKFVGLLSGCARRCAGGQAWRAPFRSLIAKLRIRRALLKSLVVRLHLGEAPMQGYG